MEAASHRWAVAERVELVGSAYGGGGGWFDELEEAEDAGEVGWATPHRGGRKREEGMPNRSHVRVVR